MPKRILISNIGNRNFLYKGKDFWSWKGEIKVEKPEILPENINLKEDFFSFTQYLWNQYEVEEKHIKPNIINTLIDDYQAEIEIVILLSSDQPLDTRKNQDTLYEGKFLQKKLSEQYPAIHFINLVIEWESGEKIKIVDNDALLRWYRDKIVQFRDSFPNHNFIVCDAGGTPQQKGTLKIMTEYLLEKEKFSVYYVSQEKNNSSALELVPQIEYRRVIDGEQIRSLIAHLEYKGAYNLYTQYNPSANEGRLAKLLQFAYYRSQKLERDADKYASAFEGGNFKERKAVGTYKDWMQDLISRQTHFRACELLSLVQKNKNIEDYTATVLLLSQFIETYVNGVMTHHFGYSDNYTDTKKAITYHAKRRFANVAMHYGNDMIIDGIPTRILICQNCEIAEHQQLISYFTAFYYHINGKRNKDYSLDTLRNGAAHEGKGITKTQFDRITNIYDALKCFYDTFELPSENIYDTMNKQIRNLL